MKLISLNVGQPQVVIHQKGAGPCKDCRYHTTICLGQEEPGVTAAGNRPPGAAGKLAELF